MINVTVGTSTERKTVIVEDDATPKDALEEADVAFDIAQIYLDGVQIGIEAMSKPFNELNITDSCRLIAVVKTDNSTT